MIILSQKATENDISSKKMPFPGRAHYKAFSLTRRQTLEKVTTLSRFGGIIMDNHYI
jgi:hypothetical protein